MLICSITFAQTLTDFIRLDPNVDDDMTPFCITFTKENGQYYLIATDYCFFPEKKQSGYPLYIYDNKERKIVSLLSCNTIEANDYDKYVHDETKEEDYYLYLIKYPITKQQLTQLADETIGHYKNTTNNTTAKESSLRLFWVPEKVYTYDIYNLRITDFPKTSTECIKKILEQIE